MYNGGGKQDVNNFLKYSRDSTYVGTINVPYPGEIWLRLNDKIDLAQYDIVYLRYNNGVDDIFRNAQLFKQVIDTVNNRKVGNEPNVVMGVSMGGLVARIALRQMEIEGKNHQTKKYISVDSPHKGANVPVGLQAAVRHFQNITFQIFGNVFKLTDIDAVKEALKILNSTAAQQMLIYSVNDNYSFDNTVHNTFQTYYDGLGFPQQCENVAISNGSNKSSLNFTPGSQLIDCHLSIPFGWVSLFSLVALATNYPHIAWNAIPGNAALKLDYDVDALKNQTISSVYKGNLYIRKKIFWLIPVNIDLVNKTVNSTATMLPIDGAPGGRYSLEMLGGSNLTFLEIFIKQSHFCFIPTVSSLALSDWSTKLTQNLTNVTTSPFHSIYTQENNQLHTQFDTSASFLYKQLYPFGEDVYIQNETITSNRYIGGKNIYVGRAVTTTKPQGNVLINNNAKVIFDAAENVIFDAGFECASGATFEIK